jgi:hypothetical protein
MRMWMRPFALTAAVALGAIACEDGVTDTSALDEIALRADVALVAADGMFQDLALMATPGTWAGMGVGPQEVGMGVEVQGSKTFSRTVTFFDAGGIEQSKYDPLTTAWMEVVTDLTRQVSHTFWSAEIARHREMEVSGLEGEETERTWNGSGTGDVLRSRHPEDGSERVYDMASSSVIENVVRALPRSENPWPMSGTITRTIHAEITVDGVTEVRDVVTVITFNGTQFVTMTVDGVEYEIDLAERNVQRRFQRRGG